MNTKLKAVLGRIFSVAKTVSQNCIRLQIIIFGIKFKFSFLDKSAEEAVKNFAKMKSALNITCDRSKFKSCLLFRYDYSFAPAGSGVNLGDYVQTIATRNVIKSILPDVDFKFYDRDNLSNYGGKPVFTLMQGWFSHSNSYLPNKKILPVFIGTHITSGKRKQFQKFYNANKDYFKSITFGCRDVSTLEFLKSLGIKSYLSRCLTLTFPKREIKASQNKVFIVDIPDNMIEYIPSDLRKDAVYISQRYVDTDKKASYFVKSEGKYIKQTESLLAQYKDNASLVITSALHCASPCIAMGIPAILIDFENKNDRFGSLDGIFKIYSKNDLISGKINFSPKVTDIEDLKKLMIKNVELSIKQVFYKDIDENELDEVREKIATYVI